MYILNGTSIRPPTSFDESNSTQMAQQRTLSGAINRDFFGSNKRVWTLNYENAQLSEFTTINTLYTNYLATANAISWQVTETNYTVASTNVHVDLQQRAFRVRGSDYLSNFSLILTEA